MNIQIAQALPFLRTEALTEISSHAVIQEIPAETEILREGQYVKVIPIVLEGLIKVFTRHKEKELLLYYIKAEESCIMSFAAGQKNEASKVYAITEENSSVLLLPVDKLNKWIKAFPELNSLFFQQYHMRYDELISTIHHVLFDKMDKRLYNYLKEKVALTAKNPLQISHRQIAVELGTAREVISRTIKKLEHEKKLKQLAHSIEVY